MNTPRLITLLLLPLLIGCGDNFNGGLRLKEAPQAHHTQLVPVPAPPGAPQFITVPVRTQPSTLNPQPSTLPARGVLWTWDYTFTPPELTHFRFYGLEPLGSAWRLLGTNSRPEWVQWFSNGPLALVACVAVDRDMAKDSSGRLK